MKRINWAIFAAGVVAIIGQTILIREGLALFGGNELYSGILLCFWLLWGGLGSILYARFIKSDSSLNYAILLIIIAPALLLSLVLFRLASPLFSLPFGETISMGKTMIISLICLAPTCVVIGALFPAASRIIKPERVYLYEGIGSFFGGILLTFLLIQIFSPLEILLFVIITVLILALLILQLNWLSLMPILLVLIFPKIRAIEFSLRKSELGNQNLIGIAESKYGVIAATTSDHQLNFYTNGLFDFSYPDVYTTEEAVHYPLLLHDNPQTILLIGGGVGNCISQIFKHRMIKRVTYLELDPLFFKFGERYIGGDLKKHDKLDIRFTDARFYIKNIKEKYDVVIVNLPDPANAQINRYYTKEFFFEVKNILRPGGILSIRVSSPSNIIGPLYAKLLKTILKTLKFSFQNVVTLPAAKTTFIASDIKIPLNCVVDKLKNSIKKRDLDLVYVNDYFIDYNLSLERLNYLKAIVGKVDADINTDLKPVCYYFTTILWGGILSENIRNFFMFLYQLNPFWFLLPLIILFFFFRRRKIIYVSVLSIGASEISAEVILIILFQVFYGYLYGWIGAIIAFYMLGLSVGTIFYLKSGIFNQRPIIKLSNIEFIISIYFASIIVMTLTRPAAANIIIPIFLFISGFFGGIHFPLSIRILPRPGLIYGVDLIGSSLGALITSIVFIPILGIVFTLIIFLLLNLIIGIGLRTNLSHC